MACEEVCCWVCLQPIFEVVADATASLSLWSYGLFTSLWVGYALPLFKADLPRDIVSEQEVSRLRLRDLQLISSWNDDWVHYPLAHVYLELCYGM